MELSSEITYEELLEFMRVIFYCPTRKPITGKMRSSAFQIKKLRRQLPKLCEVLYGELMYKVIVYAVELVIIFN